jgi:hypothetical protein
VATFARATARSIGARSYLEVGREGWGAWPELALETRHVVRSAFPVDPRTATADGLRLCEMPQDDFFAWCTDPETRYDLILVDDLGTVEDAAGCVAASVPHAAAAAAWIVLGAAGDALMAATGAALDSAPAPASDAGLLAGLRWASSRLEGKPVTVLTRGSDPARLLSALPDEAG